MPDYELGAVQERFADLVWENEPIASGELVKLCEKRLHWKKPTTYTVLRKLCEKGLLRNDDGVVRACVPQKEYYAAKSGQVVADSFHGSLPAFVAAFVSNRGLSAQEAAEIQEMIDAFKKEQ
jgi:predicted transcriptional regulator